jgi:muramoyltetrapeptide carboxypeptidase
MVIPPRVKRGDAVAIVSPSWGAVGAVPHRAERAARYLESLGLRVKFMANARRNEGWASAPPQDRADDINAAFADPDVSVVLAAIGGNHSNQLLPRLDWDLIASNPKIFQGYSDITVLHWAIAGRTGLRTFYGPALIPELGEWPAPLPLTAGSLEDAWLSPRPISVVAAPEWTDERVEWTTEDVSAPRARRMRRGDGWRWLRPGRAAGWLFGGCLETICWHIKGSANWLDLDGAVLLLEISEEHPAPAHVDAYLSDLEQLAVFDQVTGVMFGRPAGYSDAAVSDLERVLCARTESAGIPVVANVDCSHTDPMLTLPFGNWTELDSERNLISLRDVATSAEEAPGGV